MYMSFQTYRRDANPFERDTKGRLSVIGFNSIMTLNNILFAFSALFYSDFASVVLCFVLFISICFLEELSFVSVIFLFCLAFLCFACFLLPSFPCKFRFVLVWLVFFYSFFVCFVLFCCLLVVVVVVVRCCWVCLLLFVVFWGMGGWVRHWVLP